MRLLLPLALALGAAAQTGTRVLPAAYRNVEGSSRNTYPFGRADAQVQILADGPTLSSSQGFVSAIAFRADGYPPQSYTGYQKAYKLTVYPTTVTAAAMTTDPVANRGSSTGTVAFQAPLNVPTSTPPATLPRPFALRLAFTAPFPFHGGQSNLLLHVETADTLAPPSWTLDAVSIRTSSAEGANGVVADGCANAQNQRLSIAVDRPAAILGGSLKLTLTSTQAGAFPTAVTFLGFTNQLPWLPLDLAFAGMAGCSLNVEPFTSQVVQESSGAYPPVAWPIPADPVLTDLPLYTQSLGWAQPPSTLLNSVTSEAEVTVVGPATAPIARLQSIFYVASTARWSMSSGVAYAPVVLCEGAFP
jgi:hypothetical protein